MRCLRCGKDLNGNDFCGSCGTPADAQVFIKNEIDRNLADRLKDQNVIIIQTAEEISKRVRATLFGSGTVIAVVIAALGFFGYSKFSDYLAAIDRAKHDADIKIQSAKNDLDTKLSDAKAVAAKISVDMGDARQAVATQKLAIDRNQHILEQQLADARAAESQFSNLKNQLEQQTQSIRRLSDQVRELDRSRIYPSLGAEWKAFIFGPDGSVQPINTADKGKSIFVNLVLTDLLRTDLTRKQVLDAMDSLKKMPGVKLFVGSAQLRKGDTQVSIDYRPNGPSKVLFFRPDLRDEATAVQRTIAASIAIKQVQEITPKDYREYGWTLKQFLDVSGLDIAVVITSSE
jgi:hypothetical protein